jgi:hypothetical protein
MVYTNRREAFGKKISWIHTSHIIKYIYIFINKQIYIISKFIKLPENRMSELLYDFGLLLVPKSKCGRWEEDI